MMGHKPILDATCGGRMMWFNRGNRYAVFMDNRELDAVLCDGRAFNVYPDVVADFTAMPFDDDTFHLVVFDPPHMLTLQSGRRGARPLHGQRNDRSSGHHTGITAMTRKENLMDKRGFTLTLGELEVLAEAAHVNVPSEGTFKAAQGVCEVMLEDLPIGDPHGLAYRLEKHINACKSGDRSYRLYHDMATALGEAMVANAEHVARARGLI